MIIGGGMAFTFIKEAGVEIGASLYDEEGAKLVPEIKKKAEETGVELILPVDFVCSSKFGEDGEIQDGDMDTGVPEGFLGLDIGPKSIAMNDEAIKKSKTIVPRLHRVFEARSVETENFQVLLEPSLFMDGSDVHAARRTLHPSVSKMLSKLRSGMERPHGCL